MADYEAFLEEVRKEHEKSRAIAEQIIEARMEAKRAEVKRLRELVGENSQCKSCFSGDWSEA